MSKPAETAGTGGSGRSTTPSSPAAEPAAASAPANGHLKFGRIDAALEDVEQAIVRAREGLLSRQHEEGYWNGELEADAMLEADYIFLHTLLGTGDEGKMRRGLTEIFRFRKDDTVGVRRFQRRPELFHNLSSQILLFYTGRFGTLREVQDRSERDSAVGSDPH